MLDSVLSVLDTALRTASEPFIVPTAFFLGVVYNETQSLGGAIILLAVATRLALLPLRSVQYGAADAFSMLFKLHKERIAIMQKYRGDEEDEMLAELERLHAEHGVSPAKDLAKSLLPIFVQIPLCIGIFSGLRYYGFPGDASFLCFEDLSEPDAAIIVFIVLRFALSRALDCLHSGKRIPRTPLDFLSWGSDIQILTTAVLSSLVLPSGLWLYMLSSSFTGMATGEWLRMVKKKKKKVARACD